MIIFPQRFQCVCIKIMQNLSHALLSIVYQTMTLVNDMALKGKEIMRS